MKKLTLVLLALFVCFCYMTGLAEDSQNAGVTEVPATREAFDPSVFSIFGDDYKVDRFDGTWRCFVAMNDWQEEEGRGINIYLRAMNLDNSSVPGPIEMLFCPMIFEQDKKENAWSMKEVGAECFAIAIDGVVYRYDDFYVGGDGDTISFVLMGDIGIEMINSIANGNDFQIYYRTIEGKEETYISEKENFSGSSLEPVGRE